ncbi:MAG: glycosyltransferase [Elusimicrobiota bacterium]
MDRGASDAARAQIAAVREGLDPARFETSVVESSSLRELRRVFKENRPAVVHAHTLKSGVVARAAAKSSGVKNFIYTPHDGASPARSAASRALRRMMERLLSSSRPHPHLRDAYLGDFPEPLPHDDLLVGSCGRMTLPRNPDAWVLLVQRLCDSRNGVRCEWIGGGPEEAKARTDLTNMNLLMKVSVTGWLPPEEAAEKMRGMDIFVRYSRADSSPDDVLRAMALGLPVVASDLPAYRDAVVPGETGFLVKSEVELLERCQELIDDADLRRRLGAAGRERVRREFSRERLIAELSRLYSA